MWSKMGISSTSGFLCKNNYHEVTENGFFIYILENFKLKILPFLSFGGEVEDFGGYFGMRAGMRLGG